MLQSRDCSRPSTQAMATEPRQRTMDEVAQVFPPLPAQAEPIAGSVVHEDAPTDVQSRPTSMPEAHRDSSAPAQVSLWQLRP